MFSDEVLLTSGQLVCLARRQHLHHRQRGGGAEQRGAAQAPGAARRGAACRPRPLNSYPIPVPWFIAAAFRCVLQDSGCSASRCAPHEPNKACCSSSARVLWKHSHREHVGGCHVLHARLMLTQHAQPAFRKMCRMRWPSRSRRRPSWRPSASGSWSCSMPGSRFASRPGQQSYPTACLAPPAYVKSCTCCGREPWVG